MKQLKLPTTVIAVIAVTFATVLPARADSTPSDGMIAVTELTPAAEKAIQKGLTWMHNNQNGDGSWGNHKTATTALTLMAFMVKGHFPGKRPYGDKLSKGVDFLLRQNSAHRGYMGSSMYEHGLATLALSEVWGMSQRDDIREGLKNAVDIILRSQNKQGGWRYRPQPADADLSVTVMQVVALASAKEAGIFVPDEVIDKAVKYVTACQHKPTGGFGYQPGGGPNFPRSAAGVMSLMMCGQRKTPQVKAGLDWLMKQPDSVFQGGGHYFYGHYYGTQVMYQAGGKHYATWYPKIREALIKKQTGNGSWSDGNRIGTPIAILILGVPYRFLPIYQR